MGLLTIKMGTDWARYTGPVEGAKMVGTVRRTSGNVTRALAVVNGRYVAMANGSVFDLDQRSVNAELGHANAQKMQRGRRVNVYLSADLIALAGDIGRGNISLGLRTALVNYPPHPEGSGLAT